MLHLTVAGTGGSEVPDTSDLYRSLSRALASAGDGAQPVRTESYVSRKFRLKATVRVAPRRRAEHVLAEVRNALSKGFSFEQRSFGQSVAASEIVAVIQGVEGIAAVDLDALYEVDSKVTLHSRLAARPARQDPSGIRPAELLTITLDRDDVTAEGSSR